MKSKCRGEVWNLSEVPVFGRPGRRQVSKVFIGRKPVERQDSICPYSPPHMEEKRRGGFSCTSETFDRILGNPSLKVSEPMEPTPDLPLCNRDLFLMSASSQCLGSRVRGHGIRFSSKPTPSSNSLYAFACVHLSRPQS